MTTQSEQDQGNHGTGTRAYTPTQYARVAALLELTSKEAPMSVARVGKIVGIKGNTVRAIVSDLDGVHMAVCYAPEGYYVARTSEEAVEATKRLTSQIATMQARVNRKLAYAHTLPPGVTRVPVLEQDT